MIAQLSSKVFCLDTVLALVEHFVAPRSIASLRHEQRAYKHAWPHLLCPYAPTPFLEPQFNQTSYQTINPIPIKDQKKPNGSQKWQKKTKWCGTKHETLQEKRIKKWIRLREIIKKDDGLCSIHGVGGHPVCMKGCTRGSVEANMGYKERRQRAMGHGEGVASKLKR